MMQDGNIHCHIGNVSAKNEDVTQRSAIVAASYQSGVTLFSDKRQKEITARDAGDDDVIFTGIFAPAGAGDWVSNRNTLWNAVEANAKRKDARLAKKIEVAFTRDVPAADRVQLLKDFIKPFVALGCVVDVAIHNDPEDHNPHAHIMLTTFGLDGDGFGTKITAIDTRKFIRETRKAWADITNLYLEKTGSPLRVDHRSYKARGIEAEPTKHRGPHQQRDAAHHLIHRTQPIMHVDAQVGRPATEMERPEQESDMQEPTQEDKELYPHLTQREEWPPEEMPTQDMKFSEREELHRYWQDQKLVQIEEQELTPPEYEAEPDAFRTEQVQDIEQEPTYVPQNDLASRDALYRQDLEMDAELRAHLEQTQKSMYMRAADMKRTPEEADLLRQAAEHGKPALQQAKDIIMFRRIEHLQKEDNRQLRRNFEKAMEPSFKERVKAFMGPEPEHEEDYPVPGPNNDPYHQREIDDAMNRMIQDIELEPEQERER